MRPSQRPDTTIKGNSVTCFFLDKGTSAVLGKNKFPCNSESFGFYWFAIVYAIDPFASLGISRLVSVIFHKVTSNRWGRNHFSKKKKTLTRTCCSWAFLWNKGKDMKKRCVYANPELSRSDSNMIDEAQHLAQEPKYFNQSSLACSFPFLFFLLLLLLSLSPHSVERDH